MNIDTYLNDVTSHLPYTFTTPAGNVVHSREPMTISEMHDHDSWIAANEEHWANSSWDEEDETSYLEDAADDGYGWERAALARMPY